MSFLATAECLDLTEIYESAPAQGDEAIVVEQAFGFLGDGDPLVPVLRELRSLTPDLAREASRRWDEPCEGMFHFLLARDPRQLALLISSDALVPADLTFAAEILGRGSIGTLARRTITPLLGHNDAAVREGAIYGLASHIDAAVRQKLEAIADGDPSTAVRNAAVDALEQ